MERQRSFSLKPTRLLVFSFTITSSVIFVSFFSVWVIKTTPSNHREDTHFGFNKTSLVLGLKPAGSQASIGFGGNYTARSVKSSNVIDTQIKKAENSSAFAAIAVFKGLQKWENESEVLNVGMKNGDTAKSNLTTRQKRENETNASYKKVRLPISERIEEKKTRECDITNGSWVFDESYPLYTNASCPFLDEGFNCEGNGRLNKDYMKWRWQPRDCDIPMFNATKMLNLIRGKRLVFVGDSINRNQWESMLCLLMRAIRDPRKVYEMHGRRITKEKGNYSFRFVDYMCTVEYYVSHFLVHESKARVGKRRVQTLRIDTIDKGSSRWKGADILIFNTAHWWSHYKTKAGINYYQEGNLVHPRLDVSTAFRNAMMTWASWVDKYVNPRKTKVFFRSSAPSHFRGGQWNSGGHCKEATQPSKGTFSTVYVYPDKNIIAEEVIKQMKTPVAFLNITTLSEYRIDGHPSIFGRQLGKKYASSIQDCSHWCLPGVPDTWNELLYFHLQSARKNSMKK